MCWSSVVVEVGEMATEQMALVAVAQVVFL
jgi:hypothetical protein